MPSRSQLAELLAGLGQALHSLSVRWYLFGAQAAILYGAARLTADVDITADPGARSLQEIIRRLADHAFEPRVPDVDGMVDSTRVLPLVHVPTRIPVDVVLAGPGLEELFFAAVRDERIDDVRVPVAAPEDVVTMKVLAGRPRDLEDVGAILKAQGARFRLERTRDTLRRLEDALDRRDLLPVLEALVAGASH